MDEASFILGLYLNFFCPANEIGKSALDVLLASSPRYFYYIVRKVGFLGS
jgi:hypothetical protein